MQKKILPPLAVVIVLGVGIVGYVLMQKGKTPVSQESNSTVTTSENKDDSSETTVPKEGWKSYSSSKLGISFQYPEKASNMVSGLGGANGFVPVRVTEDVDKGVIRIGYGPSDIYGWAIIVKKIQGENELNAFVKDNYGKGCYIDGKKELSQKGVYELTFKGEDWDKGADLGNTTCPWSPIYKIIRAKNSNMVISINRGGEARFDDEDGILNSIRFN